MEDAASIEIPASTDTAAARTARKNLVFIMPQSIISASQPVLSNMLHRVAPK